MAEAPVRFGDRLRRARVAAGYSQEELAERAGLSANAIGALERGERKRPFPDTVRRLAEALGLTETERAELAAAASGASESVTTAPTPPRSVDTLPVPPTPLVGREREVAAIADLLLRSDTRLVTLTGAGGTGKTRLAIEVATRLRDRLDGGVAFVELAPLTDPELVLPTVASVAGVRERSGSSLLASLAAHLSERPTLLVLDNFEHLRAAAPAMADLIAAAPRARILVTSRIRLNLRAEQAYPVAPLPVPDLDRPLSPEALAGVDAVQLFVQRARAARPDFTLDATNASPVAAICRRLDGLPLAIELAAARVRTLPPEGIFERLANRLRLLTGGAHDLPERQRTLRTTLEWSYGLLSDEERALFRRLSAFSGGFTLSAAEAVAGASGAPDIDVLDGVTTLVDHSLLRLEAGPDGESRFAMLEVLREFGQEHLEDAGEAAAVRDAHLAWCVALAETAETALAGPAQGSWLARLEAEHDNLRAALGSATSAEARLRLAGALWRFWWWHSHYIEGRAWLDQLLAAACTPGSTWRAKALLAAGILAREQGDLDRATALLEESLAIRRDHGDPRDIAQALNNLGLVASYQGDFDRAAGRYEEGLALYRTAGDRLGIANVLNNLGILAREQGDFATAATLYSESLALLRELGERRGIANTLHNLGRVRRDQGDLARAVALFEESMAVRRDVGDELGFAMTLHNLGRVAREQGNDARAVELFRECLGIRMELGDKLGCVKVIEDVAALAVSSSDADLAVHLLGAAAALRDALGAPVPPADRDSSHGVLAQARQMLDAAAVDAGLAAGRAMSVERATREALAFLDAFPATDASHR